MPHIAGMSEVLPLRSVLLKRPEDAFPDTRRLDDEWRELAWTGRPDAAIAARQHEAFAALLARSAEVLYLPRDAATGLDSIYVRDAVVLSPRGAILCRMGKPARGGEPGAAGRFFAQAGIAVAGRIKEPGLLEGGDLVFLDKRTVAVGQGYRTNAEGIRQLGAILGASFEVVPVPLPHWNGPGDVLHLMSLLSPIDADLVLAHSRLLPAPFRQGLVARGVRILEVPHEEFDAMGCNVLALAPKRCLMLDGNPRTRALLETAGCEVIVYDGSDISGKGSGGPTCLTRPLQRG